jgi:hypothetical protein
MRRGIVMLNREYFRDFYYKTITPKILEQLNQRGPYDRALFIECDNGFLIEFIQANEIHGIDNPEIQSVPIVKRIDRPDKVYDLIVLSEKDYTTYSKEQIYDWVIKSASRLIVIIGSKDYMSEFKFGRHLGRIVLSDVTNLILTIWEFDESLRIYE